MSLQGEGGGINACITLLLPSDLRLEPSISRLAGADGPQMARGERRVTRKASGLGRQADSSMQNRCIILASAHPCLSSSCQSKL